MENKPSVMLECIRDPQFIDLPALTSIKLRMVKIEECL